MAASDPLFLRMIEQTGALLDFARPYQRDQEGGPLKFYIDKIIAEADALGRLSRAYNHALYAGAPLPDLPAPEFYDLDQIIARIGDPPDLGP
jgi:hypothetical protein